MSGGGGGGSTNKCGLTELLIFIAAILCGTACSICSKTMMQLHGVGMTGEVELFSKPLFQTFGACVRASVRVPNTTTSCFDSFVRLWAHVCV